MKNNMKVVILCGGQGTRLREETEFKPKPMVSIGNMPILWHIMKLYSKYGFNDFVLCLGYKSEVIKQYFMNQDFLNHDVTVKLRGGKTTIHNHNDVEDWNITLAETGMDAMTGARVKKIEKYVDGDEFMLTYGDGISDLDISKLISFHHSQGTIGTLTSVNPPSRFGMVKKDDGGVVTEFVEKPVLYDEFVNGGFYVFKKTFFDYLDNKDSCVLEAKPLTDLVKKRQLSMYCHRGFWQCMDTYRDYLVLNKIWASGNVPWRVWQ